MPHLTTRALTPEDWPVIRELFTSRGACGGCWCMHWRVEKGGKLWEEVKGEKNRRAFKKLVESGRVHGVLAFSGDEPVGWCCIGPRRDFPRLERSRALRTSGGSDTWAVTCIYIPAKWRGHGVATAMTKKAVQVARDLGAPSLEAYPVVSTKSPGARIPAAFAWTGVPEIFERCSFKDVTPEDATRPLYLRRFRKRRGD